MALVVPQPVQVAWASVISKGKTSCSMPAAALPSSLFSIMVRVQLRPLGYAVDVFGDRLARESIKLVPAPAFWLIDLPDNGKIPVRQWCMRHQALFFNFLTR